MTKHVAILGCGPAGLMAALAADLNGWDFTILSRKESSKLYGAQYLHSALPSVDCGEPRAVRYKLKGTPEQYRRKVYGDAWDGTVSPEDFPADHLAWDIRAAYQRLWEMYSSEIQDVNFRMPVHPASQYMRTLQGSFDLVVSTLPRTVWDPNRENFLSESIWALGDAEYERVSTLHRPEPFTVICNGKSKPLWYRVSNIFGYATMEWPLHWRADLAGQICPPTRGASLVAKPLFHTSTAAKDFIHLGRYGKWEKGVLTTDAFHDAMEVFRDDSID